MSGLNRTCKYEYMILKYTMEKKHTWMNTRIICLKEFFSCRSLTMYDDPLFSSQLGGAEWS